MRSVYTTRPTNACGAGIRIQMPYLGYITSYVLETRNSRFMSAGVKVCTINVHCLAVNIIANLMCCCLQSTVEICSHMYVTTLFT